LSDWFGRYVGLAGPFRGRPRAEHHFDWLLAVGSSAVALAGLGLAWYVYVARPGLAETLARRSGHLYDWSMNRFYLDELYAAVIVKPLAAVAVVGRHFDRFLTDLTVLVSRVPWGVRLALRPMQNGLLQFYGLAMVLGLTVFLAFLA